MVGWMTVVECEDTLDSCMSWSSGGLWWPLWRMTPWYTMHSGRYSQHHSAIININKDWLSEAWSQGVGWNIQVSQFLLLSIISKKLNFDHNTTKHRTDFKTLGFFFSSGFFGYWRRRSCFVQSENAWTTGGI